MQFIIYGCSLLVIFFNHSITKKLLAENPNTPVIKNSFVRLLQFVKFAPILAFLVLLVLVLTYFHSKPEIRLSHAWYDSQFWTYTALLYVFYRITKSKLSLIFLAFSFFIAIYNTPLFHYESLFFGHNVIVSDIFGIFMFLSMWISISKITNRLKS